jgi:hypothetical protein
VHERRHGAGDEGGQGRAGKVQEELSHVPDVQVHHAEHHEGRSKVVCGRAGGQAGRYVVHRPDKIVEFERTDKSRRNPTIAQATLAEEFMAAIEAVKSNKKKGKGKGKGKRKGNVADTNVAASYAAANPRPSSKQCKFCDKAGHVKSECYTKQNLEKFKHKMVSKVTAEKEPTVSGNGYW